MIDTLRPYLIQLLLIYLIALPQAVNAVDGDVDMTFVNTELLNFDPQNTSISSIAKLDDGKILIGGRFRRIGEFTRNSFARLNTNGTLDTTFSPHVNEEVRHIATMDDGKILIGGSFTSVGGVTRNRIARLNADGTLDTAFNHDTSGTPSLRLVEFIVVQGDGKILIRGRFSTEGAIHDGIARLNADGSVDTAFNPDINGGIGSIAVQSDGKILIGAGSVSVDGVTRSGIVRLNANGTLDTAFNPNANGSFDVISDIAIQNDGRILIAEVYRIPVNGTTRSRIVRLNVDGTLDTTFNHDMSDELRMLRIRSITIQGDGKVLFLAYFGLPWPINSRNGIARINTDGTTDISLNPGANGVIFPDAENPNSPNESIFSLALKGDDKILIGGIFGSIGGVKNHNIARINFDGTVDTSMITEDLLNSIEPEVRTIAEQDDGKILIGGDFTHSGEVKRNNIARLNSDGTLDTSFDPDVNDVINSMVVQGDGKILIAGFFNDVNEVTRNHIARLNSDGTLDTSFDPDVNDVINSMVVQGDGKVLIAGFFNDVSGVTRNGIARLNVEGTLDTAFNPNAAGGIETVAIQGGGKILVGGRILTFGGVRRVTIAQLNSDGTLDTAFDHRGSFSVSNIVVQRNGKILISGEYITFDGMTGFRIARLSADGGLEDIINDRTVFKRVVPMAVQVDGKILISHRAADLWRHNPNLRLDRTFNAIDSDSKSTISSIVLQRDGKILVGGTFNGIRGFTTSNVARLENLLSVQEEGDLCIPIGTSSGSLAVVCI